MNSPSDQTAPPRSATPRRRGRLKKLLIGSVVVLVLLVGAVALLVPMFAGGFIAPRIEAAVNDSIGGSVRIDSLSVSWTGAQTARDVELLDPDGTVVAHADLTVNRSLLALLRSPSTLGTVEVSGWVEVDRPLREAPTNLERAIRPRSPQTPEPPSTDPLRLPELTMTLDLTDLRFGYTVAGERIGVSRLSIAGPIALADSTDLTISATPTLNGSEASGHSLDGSLRSGPILNASRELTLDGSGFELSLSADLPGQYAALLTRLLDEPTGRTAPTASAPGPPITIRLALRESAGRLVSAGGAEALVITGPVPPGLIARLAPPGGLSIDSASGFSLRTTSLDLPVALLTDSLDTTDLREGAIVLALRTDAVDATITESGGRRTVLRIEPIDLRFGSENFSQQAFAQGDLRALVNGTPAGTAVLDLRIDSLLSPGGTIAPIDRVSPSGDLRLVDAPAGVLDPVAARFETLGTGFVSSVFGDTLTMTLTADARADLGSSDTAIESPRIGLEVDSARTTIRASAVLDGDRIDAPGEAFTLESIAGRELLERFAPDLLLAMEDGSSPITLSASANDIRAIQGTDLPIDLDRLSASVRLNIDRGAAPEQGLDRIAASIESRPGQPMQVGAVASGNGPDRPYQITADLLLGGLSALAAADDPLLAEGVTTDGSITIDGAPMVLFERLATTAPGAVSDLLGDRADGRITLESDGIVNTAVIALTTPAARFDAGLRLRGSTLSTTRPLTVASREPQRLLEGLAPDGIVVDGRRVLRITGPGEFNATVEDIALDLRRLDDAAAVASGVGLVNISASDIELVGEAGQRTAYSSLTARLEPQDDALSATLTARDGDVRAIDASARLPIRPILDGAEPMDLLAEAQRTLTASIDAPAWVVSAFAPEQAETIDAALAGEPLRVSIQPSGEGSLVTVKSGRSTIQTSARVGADALSMGETIGAIEATPDQVAAILLAMSEDGEPPAYGIASEATIDLSAEPFTVPLGSGDGFDLSGIDARVVLRDSAVVTGALDRDGASRDLGVRDLIARIAFSADGPTIEAEAEAFDPARTTSALGTLSARLEPGGRFDIRLTDGRPAAVDAWLAAAPDPGGPFALTFGSTLELRALTRTVAGRPAGSDRIEITVNSPRLDTRLLADRTPDEISLAEPFQVALTLAPAMFDELIAPVLADTEGSALRLREAAPAAVSVRSFTVGRGGGAFDLAGARIDAEFGMVNANFDALLGDPDSDPATRPVELGKIQGSITRAGGEGAPEPIRFELASLSDDLERTLFSVDGTLDTGAGPPRLSAEAQGDIPTALIDVLAGHRGLTVATLGDTVRVQASATGIDSDRSEGRLTASVQTARAEAAAFGRFEDGALILGDGAASRTNITLSEITPELSRRVFEPLFPLLRNFEKASDDQPTMITVTSAGLALPVDGDISKLNGNLSINLGTVRFEAGELLSAVLGATANRTAGQLGQSVPPVLVRFTDGVAAYDRIDIPFGDVTLRTRGSIDLVNQSMDILVLVPLETLSGDIRRAAERNPLIGQLAAVPFRARGGLGTAQLELDPSAIQDLIPGAIEGQLNDLINQGLRDLFRR